METEILCSPFNNQIKKSRSCQGGYIINSSEWFGDGDELPLTYGNLKQHMV